MNPTSDPTATEAFPSRHDLDVDSRSRSSSACASTSGTDLVPLPETETPPIEAPAPIEEPPIVVPPVDPVEHTVDVSSPDTAVVAGFDVHVTAVVEPPYEGVLEWTVDAGTIVASGGHEATFSPPDEPGVYTISATVPGEPDASASLDVSVHMGLAEPFTFVVLPDTQNMVKDPDLAYMVTDMTEWIVDQRDALNIEFVSHVGDVVSFADQIPEWERATAALDLLDGVVPYSVALGDHEYDPEEYKDGSVANYLANFGPQRYAGYDWYRGSSPDGLSHVQVFSAGGREFLHLAVEFEPLGTVDDPTSPLGWAVSILEANPTLPTIITTHAYLWDQEGEEGHFRWRGRRGYVLVDGVKDYVGPTGEELFAALVEPFPQVFMVLNGHFHLATRPDQGKFHQVSINAAGSEVYEMMSNFQSYPNGGDGWLRSIEFQPGGGAGGSDRIAMRTYSPTLDAAGEVANQTDPRGEFSFDLDFAERFDLGDPNP